MRACAAIESKPPVLPVSSTVSEYRRTKGVFLIEDEVHRVLLRFKRRCASSSTTLPATSRVATAQKDFTKHSTNHYRPDGKSSAPIITSRPTERLLSAFRNSAATRYETLLNDFLIRRKKWKTTQLSRSSSIPFTVLSCLNCWSFCRSKASVGAFSNPRTNRIATFTLVRRIH
jgi:hypothetical protein